MNICDKCLCLKNKISLFPHFIHSKLDQQYFIWVFLDIFLNHLMVIECCSTERALTWSTNQLIPITICDTSFSVEQRKLKPTQIQGSSFTSNCWNLIIIIIFDFWLWCCPCPIKWVGSTRYCRTAALQAIQSCGSLSVRKATFLDINFHTIEPSLSWSPKSFLVSRLLMDDILSHWPFRCMKRRERAKHV